LAGSFGDLGTLLPIVVAMILINKLSPATVFLSFGLFYIITGLYYRLPVPVRPLKAIVAIAVASPSVITESVIAASGIIFGAILLLLAITGTVDRIARLFTPPVVRGIQVARGLIFLKKGIELIGRTSTCPALPANLPSTTSILPSARQSSSWSFCCSTTRNCRPHLPRWLWASSRGSLLAGGAV
jgi:SulP family sulfate permease